MLPESPPLDADWTVLDPSFPPALDPVPVDPPPGPPVEEAAPDDDDAAVNLLLLFVLFCKMPERVGGNNR